MHASVGGGARTSASDRHAYGRPSVTADAPPAFTVHRIRPHELRELVAMCAEHADYEHAAYDPAGKCAALDAAIFSRPARLHVWTARTASAAVGYAAATVDYATWAARGFVHMD